MVFEYELLAHLKKVIWVLLSQLPFHLYCYDLSSGTMLSLTRAVVSGVARAPAAISQSGVTVITRFNSTAQVTGNSV